MSYTFLRVCMARLTYNIILILSLFLTGCATSTDMEQLRGELRSINKAINGTKAIQADQDAEIASLKQNMSKMEEISKETQAQMLTQDQKQTQALKSLKPRLNSIEKEILRVDDRLRTAEARLKIPSPPPLALSIPSLESPALMDSLTSTMATNAKAKPKAFDGEEKSLYEEAFNILSRGEQDKARKIFERLIHRYPNSILVVKARYWVAECYFQKRDYEHAIVEFDRYIKDFPSSELIPSAYFRQGEAFEALGDFYDANIVYKKILRDYPTSQSSKNARKKIKDLEKRIKY